MRGMHQMRVILTLSVGLALAAVGVLLNAAGGTDPAYEPAFSSRAVTRDGTEYVLAVYPLHNPGLTFEQYNPLAEYLSSRIPGAHFRLETSRNYSGFGKKLYGGQVHFALANPRQALAALAHGYQVFAKAGDDGDCSGVILVRRDSNIEDPSDLKGRKVSYPSSTALAAALLGQYYLHSHGVDVNTAIENVYAGSQLSSILNVYHGITAAGVARPSTWLMFQVAHPAESAEMAVKWRTESLPNNPLLVRNDVPREVMEQVRNLLVSLQDSEAGRKILGPMALSRFEPADNGVYEPVRAFLARFAAEVRPLPGDE
jgi:phosphonate transport system substrate-binding protein